MIGPGSVKIYLNQHGERQTILAATRSVSYYVPVDLPSASRLGEWMEYSHNHCLPLEWIAEFGFMDDAMGSSSTYVVDRSSDKVKGLDYGKS